MGGICYNKAEEVYSPRLNSEQYHMDTIQENYPDTYDFLCSIQRGLSDIEDF